VRADRVGTFRSHSDGRVFWRISRPIYGPLCRVDIRLTMSL
jgi:hypothetical protein